MVIVLLTAAVNETTPRASRAVTETLAAESVISIGATESIVSEYETLTMYFASPCKYPPPTLSNPKGLSNSYSRMGIYRCAGGWVTTTSALIGSGANMVSLRQLRKQIVPPTNATAICVVTDAAKSAGRAPSKAGMLKSTFTLCCCINTCKMPPASLAAAKCAGVQPALS